MPYDVIITGAGPAGATAARYCALAGLNTLLLDKDGFPRSKTCGGGLTMAAVRELDFPVPEEYRAAAVKTLCSYYDNRGRATTRPDEFMFLIDRAVFDNFLLTKAVGAGAAFQREKATAVAQDRDFAYITTGKGTLSARYIIGADGVHSRAAGHIRGPYTRYGKGFCLTTEVPAGRFRNPPAPGEIHIHYGGVPLGYGWVFPKEKTASVGIGGISAALKNPMAVWFEFLCKLGINCTGTLPVKGAFIPIGGLPRKTCRGRVLLAGDAAGFVEPFTGEGIKYAVRSGRLAAEAVIEAYRSGGPADRAYRRLCAGAIDRELRAALKFSLLFFGCAARIHRVFDTEPEYSRGLLEVLAGELDFSDYVSGLKIKLPCSLLCSSR